MNKYSIRWSQLQGPDPEVVAELWQDLANAAVFLTVLVASISWLIQTI